MNRINYVAAPLRVLIVCESSGTVRESFRALGHNAHSCDLLDADDMSPHHWRMDMFEAIDRFKPDLLIAHPPCTYLTAAGLHWNNRVPGRAAETAEALDAVRRLMKAPVERIAIENPVGAIGTHIRPADQYIQPYQFGEDASKRTGLWLKNLPRLQCDPARRFQGRMVKRPDGRMVERWSNQTDSGQNRLPPSPDRWKLRSKTYQGIASAMALQWGGVVNARLAAPSQRAIDAIMGVSV